MRTDPTNIYKQALEELEEIIAKQNSNFYSNYEQNHIRADRVLCEVLRARGHNELVDAYQQISKWYK